MHDFYVLGAGGLVKAFTHRTFKICANISCIKICFLNAATHTDRAISLDEFAVFVGFLDQAVLLRANK